MLTTRKDPYTGRENSLDLPITEEQYAAWQNGSLIQDAMPNLSPDEREFLISGILPSSWGKIFGEGGTLQKELEESHLENGFLPPGMNELEFQDHLEEAAPEKPEYSPPSRKIYSTKNFAPHKIKRLRPILKYLSKDIYLAGGSLRTILNCAAEEVSDFDLFFKTFEKIFDLRSNLEEDGWQNIFECPEGKLYTYKKGKHKLQLICEREYFSPHNVINSFDLSACCAVLYEGEVSFTREFVRSVFTNKLRCANVEFPVATIKRIVKYSKKGYNISLASEDFMRIVDGRKFETGDFRQYID